MWTVQECEQFFLKRLGLTLSRDELDSILCELNKNTYTPIAKHGQNNIGFTPARLQALISLAIARTNSTLENKRFKKVSEEVLPAMFFTLLLKKLGIGEFLIVMSDVPDIALVDFNRTAQNKLTRKAPAIPVEAIFIPENTIRQDHRPISQEEKVANIIISKKMSIMRYIPETILLVTLNASLENFDVQKLSSLLQEYKANPFHQVWIFLGSATEIKWVMAQLTPAFEVFKLDVSNDLLPLMY
jgi:hypothetical protein